MAVHSRGHRTEGAIGFGGEVPLSAMLDLSLPVSIELGRTKMTVQEILRLGRGSVVQLDRLAGEAIDIYVNNRLVARGEVVMVDDTRLGVTMTEIVKADRAPS